MIRSEELIEVGKLNKPHGINGEISASIHDMVDVDMLKFIVLNIEGIFVPFYLSDIRQKSGDTFLLTFEDINSDEQIREYTNKTIYLIANDKAVLSHDTSEGMFASDFIGFTVDDISLGRIGQIIDVDDNTSNVLFVVQKDDKSIVYIPIADEYLTDISVEKNLITMNLPDGLIDMQ